MMPSDLHATQLDTEFYDEHERLPDCLVALEGEGFLVEIETEFTVRSESEPGKHYNVLKIRSTLRRRDDPEYDAVADDVTFYAYHCGSFTFNHAPDPWTDEPERPTPADATHCKHCEGVLA